MNNEFGNSSKATIKDSVQGLVDQGSETVDAIKNRVSDVTDTVKEGGTAALDRTTSFIQENPLKSLAIAFGVGYLAMRIRTSPFFKVAMIGGLGLLGTKVVRSGSSSTSSTSKTSRPMTSGY
ncbi:MAG: hypothetical protein H0X17_09775 [Deltaproteobacteria bacterium]|nr:hypothetical protein [Deltaproteobacteria bacterium]